jgi:methyltransferase (TIGR00027 family)
VGKSDQGLRRETRLANGSAGIPIMTPNTGGSRTAVRVALLRALHAENDEPRIFNDYLAGKLITPEERADFENMVITALGEFRPEIDISNRVPASCMREGLRATTTQELMIARARFTEDHLLSCVERGLSQYVILGAGLDTFALRRADLQDRLTVFEIDHPSTQEFKRARLAAAGLACPPKLHFLPADFERESVFNVLLRSPYRSDRAAFFSWAGVTYYLSPETVFEVLRSIRRAAAPGSCVAFDYIDLEAFDPLKASARIRVVMERVQQVGEPIITGFDPDRLPAVLAALGFHVVEALSPEEQLNRYFYGRTDGLRASEHFHLVLAELATHTQP